MSRCWPTANRSIHGRLASGNPVVNHWNEDEYTKVEGPLTLEETVLGYLPIEAFQCFFSAVHEQYALNGINTEAQAWSPSHARNATGRGDRFTLRGVCRWSNKSGWRISAKVTEYPELVGCPNLTGRTGIVECEIIQWFVEPEARVEEFDPLCEVQSDKASVEITSRFKGVVKKLYHEAGQMAKVGQPFVDIDILGEVKEEDLKTLAGPEEPVGQRLDTAVKLPPPTVEAENREAPALTEKGDQALEAGRGKHASLATPAVRRLSKEHDVDITRIPGTGKDGRVLKEDVYKFVEGRSPAAGVATCGKEANGATEADNGGQTETITPLTGPQLHMFKTMTRSLTIPHFLYADEVDFTDLAALRGRLNKVLASSPTPVLGGDAALDADAADAVQKLTYLPFIIKAVSLALHAYPVLNARVAVDAATGRPALVYRAQHNVGVAMDTPTGLVVPVVRAVQDRSVLSVARELQRLAALARAGRLAPADLRGGTVTVSNIGNIGGTYLSPVVVEREVAILGIGRVRTVPAFADDDDDSSSGGALVRRQTCAFSWSADHRVVDGATLARAAGVVRRLVEQPDVMVMQLR